MQSSIQTKFNYRHWENKSLMVILIMNSIPFYMTIFESIQLLATRIFMKRKNHSYDIHDLVPWLGNSKPKYLEIRQFFLDHVWFNRKRVNSRSEKIPWSLCWEKSYRFLFQDPIVHHRTGHMEHIHSEYCTHYNSVMVNCKRINK